MTCPIVHSRISRWWLAMYGECDRTVHAFHVWMMDTVSFPLDSIVDHGHDHNAPPMPSGKLKSTSCQIFPSQKILIACQPSIEFKNFVAAPRVHLAECIKQSFTNPVSLTGSGSRWVPLFYPILGCGCYPHDSSWRSVYRVWSWWTPHLVGWFDRHHCHDDTALTLSDNACAKETFVDPREVIQDKREYCSHILCSVAVDPSRFIIAPLIWSWSWNHQRSEILERRRSSHNQPQGSLSWASCECTYSRLQLPIDYTDKYVEIKSFLARTHYWYQINLASLPRCFDKN